VNAVRRSGGKQRWQSRRKANPSFGKGKAGRMTFHSKGGLKRAAGTARQNRRIRRAKSLVRHHAPQRYRPKAKHPWKQPKARHF
jgi:hypothetical protein